MRFNVLPEDTRSQLFAIHQAMTQRALVQVFGQTEHQAANLVRKLWLKFADAPRQEQDLLVHNDPVALACDLVQENWADIDQEKLDQFNAAREDLLKDGQLGAF